MLLVGWGGMGGEWGMGIGIVRTDQELAPPWESQGFPFVPCAQHRGDGCLGHFGWVLLHGVVGPWMRM